MHSLLKHTSLKRQFELRQKAFKPNMHVVEDAPLYRVDAVVEERYIPPDEDNCIEMECFDLAKWEEKFDIFVCCVDYDFDSLSCVPGTEEYDNRDIEDEETSVSICDDPLVTFGRNEYENARVNIDLLDVPNPC